MVISRWMRGRDLCELRPSPFNPRDFRLIVSGVADRLIQVFRNVIGNAQSFSPPGGEIRVRASRDKDRIVVRIAAMRGRGTLRREPEKMRKASI